MVTLSVQGEDQPRYCLMTGARLADDEQDFSAEAKEAILQVVNEAAVAKAPSRSRRAEPAPVDLEEGDKADAD